MLSHVVLFWLRPDLTAEEKAEFDARLRGLGAIPGAVLFHVGTPAATDRPVIDRSYSYGLNLVFKDLAGHDAYQVHPTHQEFVARCKGYWNKVQVVDFD